MTTKNKPKVSVIVPVYNAEETLERSISSLLNQTLQEIEIIIVNDGSTDSSALITKKMVDTSDKVTSITLPSNQGAYVARMKGISKANAPWIGFLDADDIAYPQMYKRMHDAGITAGAEISICGSYRVNENRKPKWREAHFTDNELVETNVFKRFARYEFGTVALWNKLYRREIILPTTKMHLPRKQLLNEDLILNLYCFSKASSVYLMKNIYHEHITNYNSVTIKTNSSKSFIETYLAYAAAISLYKDRGDEFLLDITKMYRVQFGSRELQLDEIITLNDNRKELEYATNTICQIFPIGLSYLISRTPDSRLISDIKRTVIGRMMQAWTYITWPIIKGKSS